MEHLNAYLAAFDTDCHCRTILPYFIQVEMQLSCKQIISQSERLLFYLQFK